MLETETIIASKLMSVYRIQRTQLHCNHMLLLSITCSDCEVKRLKIINTYIVFGGWMLKRASEGGSPPSPL